MSSCPALDCAASLANPPQLEPNPDISGIGVLISFLATAYLAWILLTVQYLVVFDPSEAGLKIKGDPTDATDEAGHPTNPIDEAWLKFVSKWVTRLDEKWKGALEKLLLIMSDQQMITGIALLASGFSRLRCGISAYHWQITIYLVWFSSFTHLATLTFLRRYLYENVPLRWWRLGFMTALVIFLVAALIPTANQSWLTSNDYAGIPAWCLFNYSADESPHPINSGGSNWSSMALSVIVLVFSYATRVIKMFRWSSLGSRLYLRTKPGNAIKGHLDKLYTGGQNTNTNKWIFLVPYYVILSMLLVLRSWFDLFESMIFEITWLLIVLLWGSLRLFDTRNNTMVNNKILEENSWGFGQTLATAMLGLLLFSAIETCIETKRNKKEDSTSSTATPPVGTVSIESLDGTIHESGASQSLDHNNSNATSQSLETPHARQTGPVDEDITNQSIVAPGTLVPEQGIARSWTTLSAEERITGISLRRRAPFQRDTRGIGMEEMTLAPGASPSSSISVEESPILPHERNYYKSSWYLFLAVFNYLQIVVASCGVLTGAYNINSNDANWNGLFGTVKDVGSMFLNLLNWLIVYAPLSSLMITLPYIIPVKAPTCLRWPLGVVLFGVTGFFSIDALFFYPIPLPWEGYGIGQFLSVFVFVALVAVYLPWYWIISRKLKREAEV